ncbi:DUF3563 family protein [Actimicrobium sp. CCI2.3]|uniref:DUF3563 family protein n=1 Tax=Actimicrobium sp. CCI2.3 TaxID=3048616 RepID=UPI002AB5527C|nr:DUF3563 family protein [Actimicrobium sp. CCI2.3]MDY7574303.1 DUF3563 family protein [Actimicrobium sp. CCI2.3]MEB0023842.1 DUF3563 family protein [Actimicrobium sp. CCI2.3]
MSTLQHTSQFVGFTQSVSHAIAALGQSIVNHASDMLNTMSESFDEHQRKQQDEYLAQSTSIADLENRMHDLERQDGQPKMNMMTGMH